MNHLKTPPLPNSSIYLFYASLLVIYLMDSLDICFCSSLGFKVTPFLFWSARNSGVGWILLTQMDWLCIWLAFATESFLGFGFNHCYFRSACAFLHFLDICHSIWLILLFSIFSYFLVSCREQKSWDFLWLHFLL